MGMHGTRRGTALVTSSDESKGLDVTTAASLYLK